MFVGVYLRLCLSVARDHLTSLVTHTHTHTHTQPLTERGREQVKSLGKRLRSVSSFWRIYSSDLGRARETTRILVDVWRCDGQQQPKQHQKKTTELEVNDGDSCCYLDVTERIYWDSRLREIGKGAREGYSKDLTEQEVMEERKYKGEATSIPMEESLDEAWDRCHAWWRQVLLEASDVATSFDYEQNVLVIAHSAILRVFLRRLLGDEQLALHPHARFDERSGQLSIPNASLTVLQVPVPFSDRIKVHLQTLADAEHILNGECG